MAGHGHDASIISEKTIGDLELDAFKHRIAIEFKEKVPFVQWKNAADAAEIAAIIRHHKSANHADIWFNAPFGLAQRPRIDKLLMSMICYGMIDAIDGKFHLTGELA